MDILDDIEMDHIHLDTQAGITLGADAGTPKATGYLISTSPCGGLPLEFWGYQKPYSECSMFKVCYGLVVGLLRSCYRLVMHLLWACYGHVTGLLCTCYGHVTGFLDTQLSSCGLLSGSVALSPI